MICAPYFIIVRRHDSGGTEYFVRESINKPGSLDVEWRTRWVYSQAMADRFATKEAAVDRLRAIAVEENDRDAKIRRVVSAEESAVRR